MTFTNHNSNNNMTSNESEATCVRRRSIPHAMEEGILLTESSSLTSNGLETYHDHQLQVPTLILASQEDRLVKTAEINAMAQAIPKAQLQIFHECGHFLHVERASVAAAALAGFLANAA